MLAYTETRVIHRNVEFGHGRCLHRCNAAVKFDRVNEDGVLKGGRAYRTCHSKLHQTLAILFVCFEVDVLYRMHSRVHLDCGAGLFSMAPTAVAANCLVQEHFHSGVERSVKSVAIKG